MEQNKTPHANRLGSELDDKFLHTTNHFFDKNIYIFVMFLTHLKNMRDAHFIAKNLHAKTDDCCLTSGAVPRPKTPNTKFPSKTYVIIFMFLHAFKIFSVLVLRKNINLRGISGRL